MKAWKLLALSTAVLISTALFLRLLSGPPAPAVPEAAVAAAKTPRPAAAAYVTDHPTVARRLTPLLDRSIPVADAAQGFADPIMFAAVVHAADNLNVPFVLLKDRVLAGGTSLLDAIRAVKPNVDAGIEARRAYYQARYSVRRN